MEIESYTLDFLSFLSPKNKPTWQRTNPGQIKPHTAKNKPRPNQTPRGKEQTHMVKEKGEKITHQTQIKNKPRNKPTKIEPIKYTHIKSELISSPFVTVAVASLVCYLTCFVIFISSSFLFLSSMEFYFFFVVFGLSG